MHKWQMVLDEGIFVGWVKVDEETGEVLLDVRGGSPRLTPDGHEVPDPRPVAVPVGFKRPETLAEQVQRLVRGAISRQAEEAGAETFEEAEDFDVGDDFDPTTPYETIFDPVLQKEVTPDEFRRNEMLYRKQYLQKQQEQFRQMDLEEAIKENKGRSRKPKVSEERPSGEDRGKPGQAPGAGAAEGEPRGA